MDYRAFANPRRNLRILHLRLLRDARSRAHPRRRRIAIEQSGETDRGFQTRDRRRVFPKDATNPVAIQILRPHPPRRGFIRSRSVVHLAEPGAKRPVRQTVRVRVLGFIYGNRAQAVGGIGGCGVAAAVEDGTPGTATRKATPAGLKAPALRSNLNHLSMQNHAVPPVFCHRVPSHWAEWHVAVVPLPQFHCQNLETELAWVGAFFCLAIGRVCVPALLASARLLFDN
jgi:hypothetical protein